MVTLQEQVDELEKQVGLLMMFVNTQNEINQRLVKQVQHLSETEESDTAPHSGLILPGRLNS